MSSPSRKHKPFSGGRRFERDTAYGGAIERSFDRKGRPHVRLVARELEWLAKTHSPVQRMLYLQHAVTWTHLPFRFRNMLESELRRTRLECERHMQQVVEDMKQGKPPTRRRDE